MIINNNIFFNLTAFCDFNTDLTVAIYWFIIKKIIVYAQKVNIKQTSVSNEEIKAVVNDNVYFLQKPRAKSDNS